MGIIDIELYHMSRGKMENPKKLRNYDQPCGFSWDFHGKNYTIATQDRLFFRSVVPSSGEISKNIEGSASKTIKRKCLATFFVDIQKVIELLFH